jgi:DNA-binding transcriptional MerR regulator
VKFYLDTLLEPADAASLMDALAKTVDLNFTQDFVIQDIGVSSRIMNHWNEKGLMPLKLRIENSTYRFNFTELIWFNVVKELREFGFSLKKIKDVRMILLKSLDYSGYFRNMQQKEKDKILKKMNNIRIKDENSKKQFIEKIRIDLDTSAKQTEPVYTTIMNILINNFILYRDEIKLLIDVNGNVIPIMESEKNDEIYEKLKSDIKFDTESYITISLMKYFRKFILDKSNFNFIRDNNILNENEAHILSLVREGKAKSITIRFNEQKPYMLEVTKERKVHAEARLSEVLLNGGYQDISIKTENGNIAVTNITTKKKLN